MNFFRTDTQAALNSLLVAARETLDHYRDSIELVEPELAQIFQSISRQRRGFVELLENAVRAAGDLPAVPDPDKEAGIMLLHHVAALIKPHYASDILAQRVAAEQKLAELVAEAQATELNEPQTALLNEFSVQIAETITHLTALEAQVATEEEN